MEKPKEKPKEESKEKTNITSPTQDVKALIDSFKKEQALQAEKIEMLTKIADKKKLFLYNQRTGKKGPSEFDIRVMPITDKNGKTEDKVIVGWRTIKNDVNWDPVTRKWHENQEVELIFDDGNKQKMEYRSFILGYKRVRCRKLSEENIDGEDFPIIRLARLDTGEEYRISARFVN